MVDVIKMFYTGSTIRAIIYTYNDSDALVDVDTVEVSFIDPDGITQVDEAAASKTATGTYTYYYTPTSPTAGDWTVRAKVTNGTYISYDESAFTIVE
jgi:uncharacterized protein YfaS (alpha-2-macroglobulin family)